MFCYLCKETSRPQYSSGSSSVLPTVGRSSKFAGRVVGKGLGVVGRAASRDLRAVGMGSKEVGQGSKVASMILNSTDA